MATIFTVTFTHDSNVDKYMHAVALILHTATPTLEQQPL